MANKHIRWAFNFSKWNPSESDILLATACIQPEEKERLARFVFKKDFKSSLIGRLMMRQFVHQATFVPYNEIRFQRDDKEKPFLIYPTLSKSVTLAFNASHHGNYTILAAEVGCTKIGADIMKFELCGKKNLEEYFRLMYRTFSDSEWFEIKSSGNDKKQIAMFCRHWALKESYVKAIGVGITVNLQDIRFKINTKTLQKDVLVKDTEIYVKGKRLNWTFEEILIEDEHCIAVAINNDEYTWENENIKFVELEFCDIVKNAVPLLMQDKEYCAGFFQKD